MNIGQRKVDEKTIHQYLLVKLDSNVCVEEYAVYADAVDAREPANRYNGIESWKHFTGSVWSDRSIYSLFDTSIYQRNNVNMLLVDIF